MSEKEMLKGIIISRQIVITKRFKYLFFFLNCFHPPSRILNYIIAVPGQRAQSENLVSEKSKRKIFLSSAGTGVDICVLLWQRRLCRYCQSFHRSWLKQSRAIEELNLPTGQK